VVVVVLFIAGLQVPGTPLADVVGNGGMEAPAQYGPTGVKVGLQVVLHDGQKLLISPELPLEPEEIYIQVCPA